MPFQLTISIHAFANPINPDTSLILDGFYNSERIALSERTSSFGLGHTELSLQSAVDNRFIGRFTTVFESHEEETEIEIEEAFINTIGLGSGLNIRFGRFLSQVGYLNAHHTHSDAFSERPAVYRALLGAHYFDDGIRLNVLLPTPFFWGMGVEIFKGNQLAGGKGDESFGVYTLNTTLGGDISFSSSWQLGLSYVNHKLTVTEDEEDHDHGHDHDHSHSAGYSSENLYILDAVWKWAPLGNARNQQITLAGEYLYADELNKFATDDDIHEGWYASLVYRFHPQWAMGLRQGEVNLKQAHGDHFHDQQLEETEIMLSWSHSHFSVMRLQYTRQQGDGLDNINNTVSFQYVMSLGAHGAHEF
ncbi:MAG TPA: hypothetical protein DCZ03_03220 [Gammaproteobacteria bacterium]|nr:hypothetical protein [Gammaproteobacteria bacterium]